MVHIACVDDEKRMLETIAGYIEKYKTESKEAIEVTTFERGLDFLECKDVFDIVFLDIEMPTLDGMQTARYIRKQNETCVIIFVTNLVQYALEGYAVDALDFIVKPIAYEKFAVRLRRALLRVKKSERSTIVIPASNNKTVVDVADIVYVEVQKHKLIYHLTNRDVEAWGTIGDATAELAPHGFSRCNVCYLVNLRKVTSIAGDDVYLGATALKISRRQKKAFLNEFAQFLGKV